MLRVEIRQIFAFSSLLRVALCFVHSLRIKRNKNSNAKMDKHDNPIASKVTFRWIARGAGTAVGYNLVLLVVSAGSLSEVLPALQAAGLECLDVAGDLEYQAQFGVARGVAVYVKRHSEADVDYSSGLDPGLTIRASFRIAMSAIEKATGIKAHIDSDTAQKLTEFKELFTRHGVGWETVKAVMPELCDFDELLADVKTLPH